MAKMKNYDLIYETMENTWRTGIRLSAEKCIINEELCQSFGVIYTPYRVKQNSRNGYGHNQKEVTKRQKSATYFSWHNPIYELIHSEDVQPYSKPSELPMDSIPSEKIWWS